MNKKELYMHERLAYLATQAPRYKKATKKEKKKLLDEIEKVTHYHRKYIITTLTHWNSKAYIRVNGKLVRCLPSKKKSKQRSTQAKKYGEAIRARVSEIWELYFYPCAPRLKAILKRDLPALTSACDIPPDIYAQLTMISSATLARIIKEVQVANNYCAHRTTRGTLLKSSIPIKTYVDWQHTSTGFVELDTVGHDGGNLKGEYCVCLCITDVYTGWTEVYAHLNKAHTWVPQSAQSFRKTAPFSLQGIDFDNGGEFVNNLLINYCKTNNIIYTRSRPYKKNDNCHVEQKNNVRIRQFVGYDRYETPEPLEILHKLYAQLRILCNFLLSQRHLRSKTVKKATNEATGQISKTYDTYATPYERILRDDTVDDTYKKALCIEFCSLNIITINKNITTLIKELHTHVSPLPTDT